ncbi:methyltransferase-like protein [Lasiosphaeria miniovina]|uniref:Methyltransferase-like protein n=1 Tax=Lasiosphaeria miniovina TaxID=1954250 RepID=A0AA40AWP1_9PEZI|nr:methyltransferase-like protein [Lasiosphaeria miniovina]KAK0723357.1 methyltransferase-like protein [Lasiosphaeria miniovina]
MSEATSEQAKATSEQARHDYDKAASGYAGYSELPSGQLEAELVRIALGDCTGCTVLDLGGGMGRHARTALQLGATAVDLVDISAGMMHAGQQQYGVEFDATARLRFWQADVAQPLDHLPLRKEGYDIVMANWVFSFAGSTQALHAMLANVRRHLKPGGRFVGVRDADPWSPVLQTGKYGGLCRDISPIPGGVRYVCVLQSTPPVEFVGTCLEVVYSGSTAVYEQFGLSEVATVPYTSAPVVQRDPAFWSEFLQRPCLAVVTARGSIRL